MSDETRELHPVSVKYAGGREDWYAYAKNQGAGVVRAHFIQRADSDDNDSALAVDITRKIYIPLTSIESYVIHPKVKYVVK